MEALEVAGTCKPHRFRESSSKLEIHYEFLVLSAVDYSALALWPPHVPFIVMDQYEADFDTHEWKALQEQHSRILLVAFCLALKHGAALSTASLWKSATSPGCHLRRSGWLCPRCWRAVGCHSQCI